MTNQTTESLDDAFSCAAAALNGPLPRGAVGAILETLRARVDAGLSSQPPAPAQDTRYEELFIAYHDLCAELAHVKATAAAPAHEQVEALRETAQRQIASLALYAPNSAEREVTWLAAKLSGTVNRLASLTSTASTGVKE